MKDLNLDEKISNIELEIRKLEKNELCIRGYGWGGFGIKREKKELLRLSSHWSDVSIFIEKLQKCVEDAKNYENSKIYMKHDYDIIVELSYDETKEDYYKRLINWRDHIKKDMKNYKDNLPNEILKLQNLLKINL
jgi:hypothetical protein